MNTIAPPRLVRSLVAAVALLISGCNGKQPTFQADRKPDQPNEAYRFRTAQRLSADGTLPENALSRAIAQRAVLIARDAARRDVPDLPT